jgi:hypothetical protein
MTFTQLERAISYYYRAGDTRRAVELETERDQRRATARDRWAEEASAKKASQADRRKFGGFYGIDQGDY